METFEEWCNDREIVPNELSPKLLTVAYKVWGTECYHKAKELKSENAALRKKASAAERAFSNLVHEMYENGIRPMCDEKFFMESRLKDAEKELAEKKKDD